jgi:lipopolysaccharide export system protein LptA
VTQFPAKSRRRRAAIALTAGAALVGVLGASLSAAPPPATKTRLVNVTGDSYLERETPQGTVLTLNGSVKITSEDTTLTTALATYNKTTSVANAPGRVRIEDAQNTVVGDRGMAFYKPRDARIAGNVTITVKPKANSRNAPEGSLRREFNAPATITCDNVDYNWRDRIAVATGRLTLRYKDRTVTADKAVYYGKEERVVLTGSVHYTRSGRKDNGDAEMAVAIMTEGREEFRIPKTPKGLRVLLEVDDEDQAPSSTAATAAATDAALNAADAATPRAGGGTTPRPATSAPAVPPPAPGDGTTAPPTTPTLPTPR